MGANIREYFTSETLFVNGRVVTLDPSNPTATAVHVNNGRIVQVGSSDSLLNAATAPTIYDLGGKTLVPGFNDCHMHILPYGLDLMQADLSPAAGVLSVREMLDALSAWKSANPGSEWVLGNRYDQNLFPGAAHPTREDLDSRFQDEPVYVMQTSKHAGVANSVALRMAEVTNETDSPDGGEIVRDSTGRPTGLLLESAVEVVTHLIPRPDRAGLTAAIIRASLALNKIGVTSASDLNTGWLNLEMEIACYRAAIDAGAPLNITLYPHAPEFGGPDDLPRRDSFIRDLVADGATTSRHAATGYSLCDIAINPLTGGRLRLGPLKLFSDGALTVRTAALRQPYVDGSGLGMLLHEPTVLKDYILKGHLGGWQIAVHAIGDRAVELVLDAYRDAHAVQPRPLARHRIEHAMVLDTGLIHRFKDEDVIPVVQPEFLARLGDAYIMGLGMERASRINPTASLMKLGIPVPFSSDCPIVPGAPLDGIRAAAQRVTYRGIEMAADERISPWNGLANYTAQSAYSTFDEGEVGRIAPELRADMVAVAGDVDSANWMDVSVANTFPAGMVDDLGIRGVGL